MTDMALIPKEDYGNFCDTIRYCLDLPETQKITSGEAYWMLLAAIEEIESHEKWLLTDSPRDEFVSDAGTVVQHALASRNSPVVARFPNLRAASTSMFMNNKGVEEVYMPQITSGGNTIFQSATALKLVDMGQIASIGTSVFAGASNLDTIVLRKSNAPTVLSGVTTLRGTAFAEDGTGGKVYVPEDLIESYKTAANWSALVGYGTCEFLPLEGSEYE